MPFHASRRQVGTFVLLSCAGLLGLGVFSVALGTVVAKVSWPAPAATVASSGSRDMSARTDGVIVTIGTADVTIRTSQGVTTYRVTDRSDIDKNGEATLTDLEVDDLVAFRVIGSHTDEIDTLRVVPAVAAEAREP